jgi:hypothetical protein
LFLYLLFHRDTTDLSLSIHGPTPTPTTFVQRRPSGGSRAAAAAGCARGVAVQLCGAAAPGCYNNTLRCSALLPYHSLRTRGRLHDTRQCRRPALSILSRPRKFRLHLRPSNWYNFSALQLRPGRLPRKSRAAPTGPPKLAAASASNTPAAPPFRDDAAGPFARMGSASSLPSLTPLLLLAVVMLPTVGAVELTASRCRSCCGC